MGVKRKREENVMKAEKTKFRIIYRENADQDTGNASTKKKSSKSKQTSSAPSKIFTESAFNDGDQLYYSVQPATEWLDMKRYRSCKIKVGAEVHVYPLDTYVYINDGSALQNSDVESGSQWVAWIREVRAKDGNNVFIRVYWMYRPEELEGGRQPHHAEEELVASDHMDILIASTISGAADVVKLDEKEEQGAPVQGLFYRQKYNCLKRELSELRRSCKCASYHNPDYLLIRCPNPKCSQWLHERCILNEALANKWRELTEEATQISVGKTNREDPSRDDQRRVDLDSKVKSEGAPPKAIRQSAVVDASSKPNVVKGSIRRKSVAKMSGQKKLKSQNNSEEEYKEPWLGKLAAKLIMKTIPPGNTDGGETKGYIEASTEFVKDSLSSEMESDAEFTGKVMFSDLRNPKETKDFEEVIKCICCDEALV